MPTGGNFKLYSFQWPLYVLVEEHVSSLSVPKVCRSICVVVDQVFLFHFLKNILVPTLGKLEL